MEQIISQVNVIPPYMFWHFQTHYLLHEHVIIVTYFTLPLFPSPTRTVYSSFLALAHLHRSTIFLSSQWHWYYVSFLPCLPLSENYLLSQMCSFLSVILNVVLYLSIPGSVFCQTFNWFSLHTPTNTYCELIAHKVYTESTYLCLSVRICWTHLTTHHLCSQLH